ncbi:YccT family protein [Psychromonas sp. PT13]|uniref:YccT family protein n=1 Tax=Psychromonas sp. PT13 TaxID=3439547 RepID=UPI003EC09DB9
MRFLVLFLSLVLIPISHAATLKGVNGVELLAIDGQKISSGMLKSKDLNVTNGEHQVVVQFAKRINQQNMVYSRPTIFSIDVAGDTEIKVRNFRDVNQAESAVRKGLVWLVNNDKETIKVTDGEELFEEGFQIKPDIEKLIAKYNQTNGIMAPALVDSNKVQIEENTFKGENMHNKTQQLITIYQKSSLEEKKAFRMWLLEQDIK